MSGAAVVVASAYGRDLELGYAKAVGTAGSAFALARRCAGRPTLTGAIARRDAKALVGGIKTVGDRCAGAAIAGEVTSLAGAVAVGVAAESIDADPARTLDVRRTADSVLRLGDAGAGFAVVPDLALGVARTTRQTTAVAAA